jgi:hypothetical protein
MEKAERRFKLFPVFPAFHTGCIHLNECKKIEVEITG